MSGQIIGDNSVNKDQLKAIVERVENVEVQIKEFQNDRKEIYQEAKSAGFDPAALRKMISIRREDANKRAEMKMILETYMSAMGMSLDA